LDSSPVPPFAAAAVLFAAAIIGETLNRSIDRSAGGKCMTNTNLVAGACRRGVVYVPNAL
jgi:hypothetical protein